MSNVEISCVKKCNREFTPDSEFLLWKCRGSGPKGQKWICEACYNSLPPPKKSVPHLNDSHRGSY